MCLVLAPKRHDTYFVSLHRFFAKWIARLVECRSPAYIDYRLVNDNETCHVPHDLFLSSNSFNQSPVSTTETKRSKSERNHDTILDRGGNVWSSP